ncbi:MAG: hypothetical protein ACFFCT_12080 [Candidatus Odinarchaeota archaeon]
MSIITGNNFNEAGCKPKKEFPSPGELETLIETLTTHGELVITINTYQGALNNLWHIDTEYNAGPTLDRPEVSAYASGESLLTAEDSKLGEILRQLNVILDTMAKCEA